MKKIFITKEQANLLKESILEDGFNIPDHISNDINYHNTPFSDIGIEREALNNLLKERYQDVNSFFVDNMDEISVKDVSDKLSKLMVICLKKEEPIKSDLERICFNSLVELFDIPDGEIDFDCELSQVSGSHQFHITPNTNEERTYQDMTEYDNETLELNKRRIINSLVTGGAYYLMNEIRKHYIDEVFELDEDLPHLYSKIMKLNDYLVFKGNIKITDKNHFQSGYVKVILGNDINRTKIKSVGTIFPVLMTETLKGVLELFASHGLPKDINLSKTIIDKADVLISDPWNMRFGPIFWKLIFEDCNISLIPEMFTILVKAPAEEFISAFREIVYKTSVGQEIKNRIKSIATREKDYRGFEQDIMQKQSDKSVIEDSYFTPDELSI